MPHLLNSMSSCRQTDIPLSATLNETISSTVQHIIKQGGNCAFFQIFSSSRPTLQLLSTSFPHFPRVFPRFSLGFPRSQRGNTTASPASPAWPGSDSSSAAAPAACAAASALELRLGGSCASERSEPRRRVGSNGGETQKGRVEPMLYQLCIS